QIQKENDNGAFSVVIPTQKITVSTIAGLQYLVKREDAENNVEFAISISPDKNSPYTAVSYSQQSNLLYKMVPGLQKSNDIDSIISSFKRSLEDVRSFYGFDITVQPATEKAYVVKRITLANKDIYTSLPAVFAAVEQWNKTQNGDPAKNY